MLKSEHFLENMSTHLKNSIANGLAIAGTLNHKEVTPLHLIFALLEEKGSIGNEILKKMSLDIKFVFETLSLIPKKEKAISKTALPELNETAKKALEKSILIAYEEEHSHVGTEHLLYGLVNCKDKQLNAVLKQAKITKEMVEDQIEIILDSADKFPNIDELSETLNQIEQTVNQNPASPENRVSAKKKGKKDAMAINVFANDLTTKYAKGNLDPVIGREKEINRIIQILSRKNKNNPILIGEPGVGKTAIVEGLAKRIAEGNVPFVLKNKKILSLDLALLISGTIYRGEFESRLKQVIDEVTADPNLILFIDELHNIVGAGSNQGSMDAANILKPALARGNLRCIGATTFDEHKRYFASDPALERRFQTIIVEEPSAEETFEILKGIKPHYEKFHQIKIKEDALEAAVKLSSRYIHDNFLPDKAIDLLDEASALVRVSQSETELEEKINLATKKLKTIRENKEKAIQQEKFSLAGELKQAEIEAKNKLKELKDEMAQKREVNLPEVTAKHIASILSSRLNIDTSDLLVNDLSRIKKLNENLKNHIKGQDAVLGEISQKLAESYLGIRRANRPTASFLFVGPSGVGKTFTAKILSQELYHTDKAPLRLDMSEFSESHSVSKLLGSPAGYVGYQERNHFLETMKKRPYSIILFDEIDKAHRDVRKLLLQILDEGELTDSSGKKIKFNHSIVILTSNIGGDIYNTPSFGFGESNIKKDKSLNEEKRKEIQSRLKEILGSAILSRVNSICLFNKLNTEDIENIVSNQMNEISSQLKENSGISISATKDFLATIAKNRYSDELGIRDLEQKVTQIVQELLMEAMLQKKPKKKYTISLKENKYQLI